MKSVSIYTPRLHIRNLNEADLDAFHSYRSDPAVTQYQSFEVMTRYDAQAFIQRQQRAQFGTPGQWGQYGIAEQASGILVGDCAIKVQTDEPRFAEIGITLSPQHQKKGFGTEALRGLIDWLFRETDVIRIIMIADTENTASIQLLERAGLRREAHHLDSFWNKGTWTSEYEYAVLKREWDTRMPQ